jgi:Avidin family
MSEQENSGKIRSGFWIGLQGSTLELIVEGKQVTGRYQTTYGAPKFEDKFDVTGFTDGEFIGLVVLWEGHYSVTSWAGRYGRDEHGEYIIAMWHLVHKYHDKLRNEPTQEWDSVMTGGGSGGKWYFRVVERPATREIV